MKSRLLVADDDAGMLQDFLSSTLSDLEDFEITTASTIKKCLEEIEDYQFDVVLLDIHFDGTDRRNGFSILPEIRKKLPEAEIIIYSGDDDPEVISKARHLGASSYLAKHHYSFNQISMKIRSAVKRMIDKKSSAVEGQELAKKVGAVFVSNSMAAVFTAAANIKKNENINVLILGPTGVGKELVAEAVGKIEGKKYFGVNCAAFPETLIESELFGFEKGTFTGADKTKVGLFELFDGGTLFLDEVACLSRKAQESLLRVLQTGEFKRVNGTTIIKVRVRVICATNADLVKAIEKGEFREDLYERLNACTIKIPSLGERLDDVRPLISHFLKKHSKIRLTMDPTCLAFLEDYHWPRNVRQLENVIIQMINQASSSELEIADLPARFMMEEDHGDSENEIISDLKAVAASKSSFAFEVPLQTPLEDAVGKFEVAYIKSAIEGFGSQISVRKLAEKLQTPYANLQRRFSKYGLSLDRVVSQQEKGDAGRP